MSATDAVQGPWDVAVVGAGPVGLLLAGELAARHVRVIVLEREASPATMPKANGVVGRSAVALAERGILDGTELRVVSPPQFQFGPLPLDLGSGPDNPLHILPIPQRRLEGLLADRADALGARVRRSCPVTGFTQTDEAVEIDVSDGATASRVTARYLVGCDGARSTVRKLAGIGFPGRTSDEIARIARVTIPSSFVARVDDGIEIAGVGRFAVMRPNRLPGGGFTIAPAAVLDASAPQDLYIVSTREERRDGEESSEALAVDELQASLRRVLGAELPFTAADAVRSTVGNSRHADAYRKGRVLLAGDAAHIFNAGGSALNIGLEDAIELAPRLADAVERGASPDELDGYEDARRPAAAAALSHTRTQAALSREDDYGLALRETIGALLADRAAALRMAAIIEAS